jgi:hypothetical protein
MSIGDTFEKAGSGLFDEAFSALAGKKKKKKATGSASSQATDWSTRQASPAKRHRG